MLRNKLRWTFLGIFLLIFLTGCACDDTGHNDFVVIQDNPADQSIISSLIPTFSWHDEESCTPDKFLITLTEIGDSYSNLSLPPGNSSSYTWPTSLDPGSQYKWKMRVNADNGPSGPYTKENIFYTGPMCSGEVLVAPELVSPGAAGWITHSDLQEFRWSYPGDCLPTAFDYEFATDAAFSNMVDSDTTPDYQQRVFKTFPNCSTIFWRVRAKDGTTMGPWSDSSDFHWVRDDTCWQTHYLSDDFAWLYVGLYKDLCFQTGFPPNITQSLDPGCKIEGMIIVGDGTHKTLLTDFDVDLGSGPCPSTGLDHKTAEFWAKFGVLTPGTYCVSISRDQTVNEENTPIALSKGIWTSPRTNKILAQQTIELGPGTSDNILRFVWDPIERNFLTYPLNNNKNCRIAPYTGCPIADIAMVGVVLPIFARDTNSEWKLSEMNGTPCYIFLPSAEMDESLAELGGGLLTADLPIFPLPPDCPPPAPESKPPAACSSYTTVDTCPARCTWHPYALKAGGTCSDN